MLSITCQDTHSEAIASSFLIVSANYPRKQLSCHVANTIRNVLVLHLT